MTTGGDVVAGCGFIRALKAFGEVSLMDRLESSGRQSVARGYTWTKWYYTESGVL